MPMSPPGFHVEALPQVQHIGAGMSAGGIEDHAADELPPVWVVQPNVRDGLEDGLAFTTPWNSDAPVEMQLAKIFESYAFVISAVKHDIISGLIDESFACFVHDHVFAIEFPDQGRYWIEG